MVQKGHNKTNDFRKFKTIRVPGNQIRNNVVILEKILEVILELICTEQMMNKTNHLVKHMKEFKTQIKPGSNSSFKKIKDNVINSAMALLKGREVVLKGFES